MATEDQHELMPFILEESLEKTNLEEPNDVHSSHISCLGRAHRRMRLIISVALFVGSVVSLTVVGMSWSRARHRSEDSLSNAIALNLNPQTNALVDVAASLLGATNTTPQVMVHVDGRRSWGASLPGAQTFKGTVFYPFSGADVLSVQPIFPNARSIVLAALHHVGECQPSVWPDLPARTTMVSSIMKGVFVQQGGYFGTEEMFQHFDHTGYGVTPFLLASLSLLGEEPFSIDCGPGVGPQNVSLDLPPGKAVRILHRNKISGAVGELVYACMDLLTPSPALDRFLYTMRQQGPLTTMLKATAYIIRQYEDNIVNRRPGTVLSADPIIKVITEASQAILQDDTGVRASCLAGWSLSFWGDYVGPAWIANVTMNTSTDYDDSLHSLFCHSAQHRPLPVRFGYPMFFQMPGCPTQYNRSCRGLSLPMGPSPKIKTTQGFALYAIKNATA